MKFFVACRLSKKTGNKYVALFCNNGYRDILLTVKQADISAIVNKSLFELDQMATGEVIEIN